MFPQNKVPCTSFGDEIYSILYENRGILRMLERYTPDFCEDERINSLWVWCVENKHKFDPDRGDLTTWVKSVCRRIIDIYRKEKGSRTYLVSQFPIVCTAAGPVYYDNLIKEKNKYGKFQEKYSLHERKIDEQDLCQFLMSQVEKIIPKKKNRIILMHQDDDQLLADELGIKKNTLQVRRMQYRRKIKTKLKEHL